MARALRAERPVRAHAAVSGAASPSADGGFPGAALSARAAVRRFTHPSAICQRARDEDALRSPRSPSHHHGSFAGGPFPRRHAMHARDIFGPADSDPGTAAFPPPPPRWRPRSPGRKAASSRCPGFRSPSPRAAAMPSPRRASPSAPNVPTGSCAACSDSRRASGCSCSVATTGRGTPRCRPSASPMSRRAATSSSAASRRRRGTA